MLSRSVAKRHLFIRLAHSAGSVKVDNPYDGSVFCELPMSSPTEASAVIERASAAQQAWSRVSLNDRIALVDRFMKSFLNMKDKVARDITGQMGKPLKQAQGEVGGMMDRIKALIELAPAALETEDLPDKANFIRKIAKEPVGVVLVIAPFNYPLLTTTNAVIPALLCGNSVVIKPSLRTPLCAEHFVQAFEAAGAPKGLVTALHTPHETVHKVIQHPKVGFVAFTGSVGGGHAVYQSVSKRFIDTTLELGGKDPAYVAADADLASAVETVVDGAMYNAGQSCCAIERAYVHRSLYKPFLEAARAEVAKLKIGDPMAADTSVGPMANPDTPAFLQRQVDEARKLGAKILIGGSSAKDGTGKGRFFQPTLLADCNHKMSIMMEESFGPVLPVTPVDSDEEALRLMNDSKYGLTAAVFTKDADRVVRMGRDIEAGTVFMNRCDFLDPLLPWSGHKDTGKGVSLSRHGFRAFYRLKGYHLKLKS